MKAVCPPTQHRSEQGNMGFVCIRERCRAVTATAQHNTATPMAFSALIITDQALQALQSQNGLRNRVTSAQPLPFPGLGIKSRPCGQPVSCPRCLLRAGRSPKRELGAACTRNTAQAALGECKVVELLDISTNFIPFLTPLRAPSTGAGARTRQQQGGCVSPSNPARTLRCGVGHVICSCG